MVDQTQEALVAEIARLQAENAKLHARMPHPPGVTPKISVRGALSVYGLGRFPVTLYRSQWEKLFAEADNIRAFIVANQAALKDKVQG